MDNVSALVLSAGLTSQHPYALVVVVVVVIVVVTIVVVIIVVVIIVVAIIVVAVVVVCVTFECVCTSTTHQHALSETQITTAVHNPGDEGPCNLLQFSLSPKALPWSWDKKPCKPNASSQVHKMPQTSTPT